MCARVKELLSNVVSKSTQIFDYDSPRKRFNKYSGQGIHLKQVRIGRTSLGRYCVVNMALERSQCEIAEQ